MSFVNPLVAYREGSYEEGRNTNISETSEFKITTGIDLD